MSPHQSPQETASQPQQTKYQQRVSDGHVVDGHDVTLVLTGRDAALAYQFLH